MDAAAGALFAAVVRGLVLMSVRPPMHTDDYYSSLSALRDRSFLGNDIDGYTDWFGCLSPMLLCSVKSRCDSCCSGAS